MRQRPTSREASLQSTAGRVSSAQPQYSRIGLSQHPVRVIYLLEPKSSARRATMGDVGSLTYEGLLSELHALIGQVVEVAVHGWNARREERRLVAILGGRLAAGYAADFSELAAELPPANRSSSQSSLTAPKKHHRRSSSSQGPTSRARPGESQARASASPSATHSSLSHHHHHQLAKAFRARLTHGCRAPRAGPAPLPRRPRLRTSSRTESAVGRHAGVKAPSGDATARLLQRQRPVRLGRRSA